MIAGGRGPVAFRPRRRPVDEQRAVADLAHLHQAHAPAGERGLARQAGRRRVADEEGRDHHLQLVDDSRPEEQGVDRRAALDHEARHLAVDEVGQHGGQPQGLARVDHRGDPGEPSPELVERARRGVDEPLPFARGEELRLRVQPGAGAGQRDFDRRRGRAPFHALGPSSGGADEQAGVVGRDRPRSDQDGVDPGPLGVDPVQVLGAGEDQPLGASVVDVAVERHRDRHQHERALH